MVGQSLKKKILRSFELTKPCSRHRDNETANIAEMSNVVGLDEGQQDVVVLLALVLVHGGDLVRLADQRVVGTPEKLQRKSVSCFFNEQDK